MERYDLVVIGGGSGGLTAAIIGGRLGARTLLIDKTALGGDCLHTGCVPSKSLIASARMAHKMRRAADWGIRPVEVEVDFAAVMQRIKDVQAQIAEGESPEALAAHNVEVAFGGACFEDPHTIRIGEDRLVHAKQVVIATGSRAAVPSIPGLDATGYLTNENVFELTACPARLCVIGGGPIGCELSQAFGRLGAKVTVVQRGDRLLNREIEDVSAVIANRFQSEGIDVRLNAEVTAVHAEAGRNVVRISTGDEVESLEFDAVLVAVGRQAVTHGLRLESAGVESTARGITVDDALRTSKSHIYAVGDCTGGPQFTHWAEREGRVAARNALFHGTERRSLDRVPAVTFTDPEVAHYGLTLKQATAREPDAHAHRVDFSTVDRAITDGVAEGFVEVVVDGKDRVLGAQIVGPEAGEVLTEWIIAIDHGISLREIGSLVHPYPTLTRVNRRVADARFFAHDEMGWLQKLARRF